METSQPTTDRFTLTLIARPAVDKKREIVNGRARIMNWSRRQLATKGLTASKRLKDGTQMQQRIKPGGLLLYGTTVLNSTEPRVPPRAGGGTPDPLRQGRPPSMQQNRRATSHEANKKGNKITELPSCEL